MSERNLNEAFAGESMAHMRYMIFSKKALDEGYHNISRLFKAISFAEKVHATNHFKTLANLKGTVDNLQTAIDGETYEVEEMYPSFNAVAKLQEEAGAVQSINYALNTEKIHAAMYKKAKQAVAEGRDIDIGKIHICGVCGYTGEGEVPEACPFCGAKPEAFEVF
jgi:rubrerythrin